MRENRASRLVGWKTHPTILPRSGFELTTSRTPQLQTWSNWPIYTCWKTDLCWYDTNCTQWRHGCANRSCRLKRTFFKERFSWWCIAKSHPDDNNWFRLTGVVRLRRLYHFPLNEPQRDTNHPDSNLFFSFCFIDGWWYVVYAAASIIAGPNTDLQCRSGVGDVEQEPI